MENLYLYLTGKCSNDIDVNWEKIQKGSVSMALHFIFAFTRDSGDEIHIFLIH
jgi:hypothetical protein